MENPQNQVAQSISSANNLLVTVSNNPSVDQLAAAIGLALLLNKMGKHATAVFSGQVPSTIEFLEPEKTLEKNTNSLRDFIIALDKSKADKLRYKVEDKQVKIFITPYRTSIDQEDLEFSQGDFNVDAVIALGVKQKEQLDQAITAHGRILHDAVVISINNDTSGELGSQNWVDTSASSLCEMIVSLIDLMKKDKELLDGQTATAFLTGIVAETQRFSNAKTNAKTMTISSELMAAGANQQLVATKLEPTPLMGKSDNFDPSKLDELVKETKDSSTSSDGAMKINHNEDPKDKSKRGRKDREVQDSGMQSIDRTESPPEEMEEKKEEPTASNNEKESKDSKGDFYPYLINQPPLSSQPPNSVDGQSDNYEDPDVPSLPQPDTSGPILSHRSEPRRENPVNSLRPSAMSSPPTRAVEPPVTETKTLTQLESYVNTTRPVDPVYKRDKTEKTLSELERYVDSPHVSQLGQPPPASSPATYSAFEQSQNNFGGTTNQVDSARSAVNQAMGSTNDASMEPIMALNAAPVNLDFGHDNNVPPPAEVENPLPQMSVNSATGVPNFETPQSQPPVVDTASQIPLPPVVQTPSVPTPPSVPPPMMPPSFIPAAPAQPQGQSPIVPPVL